jgi:hypothetical protein
VIEAAVDAIIKQPRCKIRRFGSGDGFRGHNANFPEAPAAEVLAFLSRDAVSSAYMLRSLSLLKMGIERTPLCVT